MKPAPAPPLLDTEFIYNAACAVAHDLRQADVTDAEYAGRLIAAAPEIAAELERVEAWMVDYVCVPQAGYDDQISAIRAILAKIKGEK